MRGSLPYLVPFLLGGNIQQLTYSQATKYLTFWSVLLLSLSQLEQYLDT